MTDKEKIIAEIERRYNKNNDKLTKIPEYCDEASILRMVCAEDLYFRDFINSLPAEQPSEDLKKEIDRFQKAKYGGDVISVASIACHFAIWQKEQMLKSAIDATCVLLPPPDLFKVLICHEVTDKLANKQKIKILIVKEDEQ